MKSLTQNKEKRECGARRQGRGSSVGAVIGADVRGYFAELEYLAREAQTTTDARVVRDALAILAKQGTTATEMLERL